jgi:phytol kinase
MAIVKRCAEAYSLNAELQRKLIHIGTGVYALTLPWLFADRWPVYMLVGITLAVMLVLRLPKVAKGGIGSTLHGVNRTSYGDVFLAMAVGLCLFFAQDQLYLYVLPIAVLTLGDAAAALAGTAYGSRFFRVEDGQKSVEGCCVFFGVTLVLSMVCLMMMTPFEPLNIILLSMMVAGFGTLVEAVSWRGFDNLFLPIGILLFLASHADRDVWDLISLAGLFGATLVGFRAVAPIVGLSNHAARVYVTTVFILLAVTAFHNAVLPITVFLAHAWARSVYPSDSAFPDLDIVASIALVSLFWLTLGNATGWNAISFYGMTAMGMALGLCALALVPKRLMYRIIGLGFLVVILCLIRQWSLVMNTGLRNWNGPMWPAIATNLTFIAAIIFMAPTLFHRYRVTKLTLASGLMPFVIYSVETNFGGFV